MAHIKGRTQRKLARSEEQKLKRPPRSRHAKPPREKS
jgi:hypothetical protein